MSGFLSVIGEKPPRRRFLDGDTSKHINNTVLADSVRLSAKRVGCEFCPLNKVPGIHKVFGEVHGREVSFVAWLLGHKRMKRAGNSSESLESSCGRN